MAKEVGFERVAPVVPVRDLDAALDRYRRLGFDVDEEIGPERYTFINRGAVSIHLNEWNEHDPGRTGAVVYIYVTDADAVHAEWSRAEVEGEIGAVTTMPYGLREFGYVDPEGTLHRVGSVIPSR